MIEPGGGLPVRFELYVAGEAPNSLRARSNLAALCSRYLEGRHRIEVIDVFQQPQRALEDGILLTPQLVLETPAGRTAFIGDLSDPKGLLYALGIDGDAR